MKEMFLQKPNLPDTAVRMVLMSDRRPACCEELHRLGLRIHCCGRLNSIAGAEAFHADMSVLHIGDSRLFVSPELPEAAASVLQSEGFLLHKTSHTVTAKKPLLNVCLLPGSVLCHTGMADPDLLEELRRKDLRILHTNQRYARCAAAIVSDRALITADPSITALCRKHEIDVLPISPGHIALDGFDYGFIGGACGLIDPHTLAFCGDIRSHPDYPSMRDFASGYGVRLYALSREPLYDIGGILPLKQAAEDSFTENAGAETPWSPDSD